MKKRIFIIIINLLLFWAFVDAMPGISTNGERAMNYIFPGLVFGFLMLILPDLLSFFKFPKNFWGKFLIGSILTLMWLGLLNAVFTGFLTFGPSKVGYIDMVLFTIPTLFTLPNALAVIFVGSLLLNICSIILFNLSKGD